MVVEAFVKDCDSEGLLPCTHQGALSVKIFGLAPSSTLTWALPVSASITCSPLSEVEMLPPLRTSERPRFIKGGGAWVMPSISPRKKLAFGGRL